MYLLFFLIIPQKSRFTYAPTMSVGYPPSSRSFKRAGGGERRVRRNTFGIPHVCCLTGCWAWLKSDWLDFGTVRCPVRWVDSPLHRASLLPTPRLWGFNANGSGAKKRHTLGDESQFVDIPVFSSSSRVNKSSLRRKAKQTFMYRSCLDDNVFVGRPLLRAS